MQRKFCADSTGDPEHPIPVGILLHGNVVLPSTGLVILCMQCLNPGEELPGISSHYSLSSCCMLDKNGRSFVKYLVDCYLIYMYIYI